ncbi:site-2 protease family protein [Candidatus Uhrbacteria bacterium]|nr:site-2 protease family protein [Candidatus Uhrbacteria bacterium]
MPLDLIIQQPALGLAWVVAILFALSIHEFSHAAVGTALGDPTARDAGRLTVNPLSHIDALGFLMLLLIGFGWGKPVPFDPHQLRNRRWGPALVALAGPTANLIGLVVAGVAIAAIDRVSALPANNLLVLTLAFFFQINLVLFLFNLIPIPPLDGSKLLLGALDHPRHAATRFFLETRGPMLLLGLIIVDSVLGGAILGRLFHGALRWAAGLF